MTDAGAGATLASGALVQRLPSAITAEMDGKLVALNADVGVCFGLNGSATCVWNLIDTPIGIDALCDRIAETYAVGRSEMRADVLVLLEELVAAQLARVVDRPA